MPEEFQYLPLDQIIVHRDIRQRRVAEPGDLTDSIRRIGVLNPIIIRQDFSLVAGERRLNAAREAGLEKIPVRFFENLSDLEASIIELEENLKRVDLPWKDQVLAVQRLHNIYCERDADWSQHRTAKSLGVAEAYISYCLRVAQDLDKPQIAEATSMRVAYGILSRKDERAAGAAMSEILEAGAKFFDTPEPAQAPTPDQSFDFAPAFAAPPRQEESAVLHADFSLWAPSYSGQKFNFIHCDFPYGVNAFAGPQSGKDKWTTYDDSPDTYWHLVEVLCSNLDRLMAAEAHLMFWLAGDINIQYATLQRFAALAPSLAFQTYPLIWHKSDNAGVLPDHRRGPRRVYETALMASREDRLIAKPVANFYAAPTNKEHHASTKPEPMLRFFFQMFVDESSRMLDPTCGSGAALRAAESLGAKHVLGLEIEEEHCDNARAALRSFRAKRALEKTTEKRPT